MAASKEIFPMQAAWQSGDGACQMGKKRSHLDVTWFVELVQREAGKSGVLARREQNKIKFTALLCESSSTYVTWHVEDVSTWYT